MKNSTIVEFARNKGLKHLFVAFLTAFIAMGVVPHVLENMSAASEISESQMRMVLYAIPLISFIFMVISDFAKFKEDNDLEVKGLDMEAVGKFDHMNTQERAEYLLGIKNENMATYNYLIKEHKRRIASKEMGENQGFFAELIALFVFCALFAAYSFAGLRHLLDNPEAKGLELGDVEIPYPLLELMGVERSQESLIYVLALVVIVNFSMAAIFMARFISKRNALASKIRLNDRLMPVNKNLKLVKEQ